MSRLRVPLAMLMFVVLSAVCLIAAGSPAIAADSDRGEKWQFYIPITYINSDTIDGDMGTSLDLSGDESFGFAFGYNFNEKWILGFEFTWMDMNYSGNITEQGTGLIPISGTADAHTFSVTGQYNFIAKTITPFIRAGIGTTHIDSNIPDPSSTGTGCFWYPWWGYVCGTWQSTYENRYFSYNAGLGVRADLTDTFWLDLSYNGLWIDTDNGTWNNNGTRFTIGWLF